MDVRRAEEDLWGVGVVAVVVTGAVFRVREGLLRAADEAFLTSSQLKFRKKVVKLMISLVRYII